MTSRKFRVYLPDLNYLDFDDINAAVDVANRYHTSFVMPIADQQPEDGHSSDVTPVTDSVCGLSPQFFIGEETKGSTSRRVD
jgi:hypothetical protein